VGEDFAHPEVNDSVRQGMSCDHNRTCRLDSDLNVLNVVNNFIDKAVDERRRDLDLLDMLNRCDHSIKKVNHESRLTLVIDQRPAEMAASTVASQTYARTSRTTGDTRVTAPSTAPSQSLRVIPTTIRLPCFVVPYDQNEGFFGRRAVLDRIWSALDPRPGELRSFALSGPGGMGKTQVATQFVYEHRAAFDAVLWVQAADTAEAQDELLTRDLVLGWLARPRVSNETRDSGQTTQVSWLLVFDNADTPQLLDDFWPRTATGSVLITSRDPLHELVDPARSGTSLLNPFSTSETANFILKITHREEDEEDRKLVVAVAKMIGGVPLAAAQIAGSILRRDMTFAEFVQEYDDPRSHNELFRQPVGNKRKLGYEHTILSVWGIEKLKVSGDLLDVLSFLDPDGIPEQIFQDIAISTDMENFLNSQRKYENARAELLQSSMVSRHRTAKILVTHRLIQDTVRAWMSDERYSVVCITTLQVLSGAWPYEEEFGFIKNETSRWLLCNELYKHILHIRSLATRLSPPLTISKPHIQPPKLILEAAW
jgi:hypothetical protein